MPLRQPARSLPITKPSPNGLQLSLDEVRWARGLISDRVLRTPLVRSESLSRLADVDVYLKLESHQTTGSFKLRGASLAILTLDSVVRRRGVVTASTGNHGRALAHAARSLGVSAVVCMSSLVPDNKVRAIRELGAEICISGHSQDDAQAQARHLAHTQGMSYIPPFDHLDVVLGQATLGLEICEQLPGVGTLVIPLSGGGLFSGVALAAKQCDPSLRTIGVSMQVGCAMHTSLKAGQPVDVEELPTLADSLGGGIGLDNRHTFALVRALADETVLVNEADIARGLVHAYMEEREVVEGAGAVGIAALLAGQIRPDMQRRPIVLVLSGRNIDMDLHRKLICSTYH